MNRADLPPLDTSAVKQKAEFGLFIPSVSESERK